MEGLREYPDIKVNEDRYGNRHYKKRYASRAPRVVIYKRGCKRLKAPQPIIWAEELLKEYDVGSLKLLSELSPIDPAVVFTAMGNKPIPHYQLFNLLGIAGTRFREKLESWIKRYKV